jgi:outer membrane protein assembly factor BamE (lipoprotein component of BamABCDE complex)
MRWITRPLTALLAMIALAGCDPGGQVYEDLRLAQLKEGQSTEADVRRLFGPPEAVRETADGKGLVYPLGPNGTATLLLRIGRGGTYEGRENLLTRANFERVRPGMSEADVLALLARPGRREQYGLKQETAWEWRFNDGAQTRVFVATFNAAGRVVSTAIEEVPRIGE